MAIVSTDLKTAICTLFEVYEDENNVQRIVTPLEYSGTDDRVVIRVRPLPDGTFLVDENGESAFHASMADGDTESEASKRWLEGLDHAGKINFDDDEVLSLVCKDERLIAPSIFKIAEAAQQLFAVSTSRADRQASDFKDRLGQTIASVCQ